MPVLFTLLTSLGRAVLDNYVTSDEALKWARLALNVVDSGVDVQGRLEDLEARIIGRLSRGDHFEEGDFDEIVSEIEARDAAWADL